jgi:predicted nucleic acid-binding protein
MRIYLDACCLYRPLDDQTQIRIRIESEAVRLILEQFSAGAHRWVCSEVVEDEVLRNPNEEQRSVIAAMLRFADERLQLEERTLSLARTYVAQGLETMDALHLAASEIGGCDLLLTTDDAFLRRARQIRPAPRVRVENPAAWLLGNPEYGTQE